VIDVERTRVSCGDRMKSCVLVDVCECDGCRADTSQLRRQNEELCGKVDRMSHQCRELNNRLTQQNHLQEKMRQRLSEMDIHAQQSSQQVLCLTCLH